VARYCWNGTLDTEPSGGSKRAVYRYKYAAVVRQALRQRANRRRKGQPLEGGHCNLASKSGSEENVPSMGTSTLGSALTDGITA